MLEVQVSLARPLTSLDCRKIIQVLQFSPVILGIRGRLQCIRKYLPIPLCFLTLRLGKQWWLSSFLFNNLIPEELRQNFH